MSCQFFPPDIDEESVTAKSDLCLFMESKDPVMEGSGIIIPRAHRETVFNLTTDE